MQQVFPIFIGARRSGTTLLRSIFDSHPDLAVANEPHFLVPLARRQKRYQKSGRFDSAIFLNDLLSDKQFLRLGLSSDMLKTALNSPEVTSFPSAVRAVFFAFASQHRKRLYGDKTPNYVNHLDLIGRLLPETRFIHILRDGRDVAASAVAAPFGPRNLAEAAWVWRTGLTRARKSGEHLGPSRYREIRYEDLVEEPTSVVQTVCEFLSMEFDPQMLNYYERADELIGATNTPNFHMRLAEPPSRQRDWRRELSRYEVGLFEAIAGDTLDQFGYALSNTEISLRHQVNAAVSRAEWDWLRVRSKWSLVRKRNRL